MSTPEEEAAAKAAAESAKAAADEDNKPITKADLKAMFGGRDLNTVVHAAAATHSKRAEAQFAKQMADAAAAHEAQLTALREEWEAKLAGVKAPKVETTAGAAGAAGPQSQAGAPAPQFKLEEHPDFLAMRKQHDAQAKELERLKSKQAEEQKKAADAVAKERKTALRSRTEELLSKYGVASGRAAHARTLLTHPDNNRIDYAGDDSEDLIFVNDDGEKVPLEKGLKAWMKGDDAKFYLPPLVPNGSGSGAGRTGSTANDNIEDTITAIHAKLARG